MFCFNSEIDGDLARGIAHGLIDPISRQPYPDDLIGELKVLPPSTSPQKTPKKLQSHSLLQFFSPKPSPRQKQTEEEKQEGNIESVSTTVLSSPRCSLSSQPAVVKRRLDFIITSRFFPTPDLSSLHACEVLCLDNSQQSLSHQEEAGEWKNVEEEKKESEYVQSHNKEEEEEKPKHQEESSMSLPTKRVKLNFDDFRYDD